MPIKISNVSEGKTRDERNDYEIEINGEVVARFQHFPRLGLAACLWLAAAAASSAGHVDDISHRSMPPVVDRPPKERKG